MVSWVETDNQWGSPQADSSVSDSDLPIRPAGLAPAGLSSFRLGAGGAWLFYAMWGGTAQPLLTAQLSFYAVSTKVLQSSARIFRPRHIIRNFPPCQQCRNLAPQGCNLGGFLSRWDGPSQRDTDSLSMLSRVTLSSRKSDLPRAKLVPVLPFFVAMVSRRYLGSTEPMGMFVMQFGQKAESPLNKIILLKIFLNEETSPEIVMDSCVAVLGEIRIINDESNNKKRPVSIQYVRRMLLGLREPSRDFRTAARKVFVEPYNSHERIGSIKVDIFSERYTVDDLRHDLGIQKYDLILNGGLPNFGMYFDNMREMPPITYSGHYAIYFPERGSNDTIYRGLCHISDEQIDRNILRCVILVHSEEWRGFMISDGYTNNIIVENVKNRSEIVSITCTRKTVEGESFRGVITSIHQGSITIRPIYFRYLGKDIRALPDLASWSDNPVSVTAVDSVNDLALVLDGCVAEEDERVRAELPDKWWYVGMVQFPPS